MSLFTSFDINGSGLTAQRFRMDIISENIANANTTIGASPVCGNFPSVLIVSSGTLILPYSKCTIIFSDELTIASYIWTSSYSTYLPFSEPTVNATK